MNLAMKGLAALALLVVAGGAFAQHVPDYDPSLDAGYAGAYDYTSGSKTVAGETVENLVKVDYMVEGVQQSAEWNTDDGTETGVVDTDSTFLVDRVVLLNVYTADAAKSVAQLQEDAYLTFEVRNDSNDTIDAVLSVHELGDTYAGATFTLYADTDDSGTFNTGDLPIAGNRIQNMAQGGVERVFAVGDIPDGLADGDTHAITLMATAHVAGGGAAHIPTTGAGTAAAVDTVFGDLAGDYVVTTPSPDQDIARDGRHSDTGAFDVAATTINVSKMSAVVEDPFNGNVDPKAIPGATVLYCIAVENAGASDATNISISDVVPDHTTYVDGSIRVANGAVTCNEAAHASATVTITDANGDDATESTTNGGISGNDQGPADTVPTVRTLVESLNAAQTTTTLFKVTIN